MDFATLLTAPADVELGTGTNADAVATIAGRPGFRHLVVGVTVSASGAVAAPVLLQIVDEADGVLDQFYLPAGAFTPVAINYNHPLRGTPDGNIVTTLPALGVGIIGSVTVRYIDVRA
jgi:hypothetical protein